TVPLAPDVITGRAVLDGLIVHVHDIVTEPDAEFATNKAIAQATGARTLLGVPLMRKGSAIGAIGIFRKEVRPFSPSQIALVKTFADQAVIAIENTRLFNELQARTAELGRSVEELEALGEVGSAVSSTLDLDTVLTTIVTHATQLSGTQSGLIYDYDEGNEELRARATIGLATNI